MSRLVFLTPLVLSIFVTLLIASDATIVSYRQTIGPPVMFAPDSVERNPEGRLIVVSWNVHVGHGHVESLIDRISDTERAHGFGKPEFVLLLQEAFRQSTEIPDSTGIKVPRRIAPPNQSMDIEDLARKLGWWMYYAPSMRNGDGLGENAEDRGNAIISSLPLKNVEAVELPFVTQRRVALAATVADHRNQPKLRVAVTHFDTRATLLKGWIFGGPAARNKQARGLVAALKQSQADRLPLVIGGDLNTYLASGSVIDTVSEIAPHADCGNEATHALGLRLDHIFASIPEAWPARCERSDHRLGSDHYPLVLSVTVPW